MILVGAFQAIDGLIALFNERIVGLARFGGDPAAPG